MGTFRVVRTPNSDRRQGRNFGRLKRSENIVTAGEAIQVVDGQITFVIASGQPFTQSAAGLSLSLAAAGGLEVSSSALQIKLDTAGEDFLSLSASGLNVDEDVLYSWSTYYG